MSDTSELIALIKERDSKNLIEMAEMRGSIQKMSDNFAHYWKHLATVEEERKHDAEFKKDVRAFIKESTPVILKAKDIQEIRGKLLIAAGSFIMLGILAFFFKF